MSRHVLCGCGKVLKEAPVAVGIGELLWDMLPQGREMGGAPANFAYHALALGADAYIVSKVGEDDLGREILSRLKDAGLNISCIGQDREFPTGTVSVELLAGGQPRFTIHERVAWDFLSLGPEHAKLARRADVVCFGTLGQRGPAARAAIGEFLSGVCKSCLRVFDVNLRQSFYSRELIIESLERCDAFKLNDQELPVIGALLGRSGGDEEIIRALIKDFQLRAVALTRGAHGSLLCGPGGERAEHAGSRLERVVSTVGAGDSFTASFALGLLAGDDLAVIGERANRLAGYVCTQPGGMPPVPERWRQSA
jgi:fructokinase